jgi:hypothetical protein
VRLWAADTGALLQTLEGHSKFVSQTLSFDVKGNSITIDAGTFVLQTELNLFTASNDPYVYTLPITEQNGDAPNNPEKVSFGINRDETWITYNNENILWLPVDCRPACSAILRSTVVVGCKSGRVLILRFKDSFS